MAATLTALAYIRRNMSASRADSKTIIWSICIRPCSGASGLMHCDGKSGPKMGIRAPAMGAQKVAQTALAQVKGIQ